MCHIGLWIAPISEAETTVETARGLKVVASSAVNVATSRETAEVAETAAETVAEIVAGAAPTIPAVEVTPTTPVDVVEAVMTVAQLAVTTDAAQAALNPLTTAEEVVVVPEAALMTAEAVADPPSAVEVATTRGALPAVTTALPMKGKASAPTDLVVAPEALLDVSEDQAMHLPPETTPQPVTTTGQ